MKAPAKNIATDLKGQSISGRGDYMPTREAIGGRPSMTVPGEGGTTQPVGAERVERSAAAAANAMGNVGKLGR